MKCCIIGLGVFGRNLALHLARLGADVLAIDRREENVALIKDHVAAALVMEFDDPTPLEHLPIAEMDAVVGAIGDSFEASITIAVKAQELGARRLVCRVLSPMHQRLLRLMKIDRLVVPEEVAARGLAHSLLMRGVVEGFDVGDGHAIIEAIAPAGLIGRTLANAAELFKRAGVRLVTIKRPEREKLLGKVIGNDGEPLPRRTLGVVALEERFAAEDVFVLFGPEKGLREFLDDNSN
jgi:trk system potassium uptake protein TrkA